MSDEMDNVEWLREAPQHEWNGSALNKCANEIERLRGKVAMLQAALKPFAARIDNLESSPLTKHACAAMVEIEHLRAARDAIQEGGKRNDTQLWRHLKTGGVYEVVGECVIEETLKPAVLYRSAIKAPGKPVWARPKDEFHDGRFEKIDDAAIREGWKNEN